MIFELFLIFWCVVLTAWALSFWGWYRLHVRGSLGYKIIDFYYAEAKVSIENQDWRDKLKHAGSRCDEILDARWGFGFAFKTGLLWALGFKETVIKMYPHSEEYRHLFDEI